MRLGEWELSDIPPLEYIVEPWCPVGGIVLLHGPRGISKTNVGMGIALSVAEGLPFLSWAVPKPRKVLYIDGEMQMSLVKDRLCKFQNHTERKRARQNLEYLSYAELLGEEPEGFGDLADLTGYGRRRIAEEIIGLRGKGSMEPLLLILDNKSCLMSTPDDNANTPKLGQFVDWLVMLRAHNVSTILIHHDGKGGKQHGSSALERTPDAIVHLTQPAKPTSGTIPVCWTFDKLRNTTVEQDEYYLNIRYDDKDKLAWLEEAEAGDVVKPLSPEERAVLTTVELNPELTLQQIGDIVGVHRSTVMRILRRHGVATSATARNGKP